MDTGIVQQVEDHHIRSAWSAEEERWYFSIVDVVGALTDSSDPRQYVKRMRSRDAELNANWGTICTPVRMTAADGKNREVLAANTEGVLRIIQSIPSKRAEPFKQWLAQVGAERIQETIDPELAMQRAMDTYAKKGYSEGWIRQRLLSIDIRKELTSEWQQRGVRKGSEFAILTDEISRAWSGMSTREYKDFKGLTNENLRDNMSNTELVLNMLAETTTTEISRAEEPISFEENCDVARRGGTIAGNARKQIEAETGRPVITAMNALDFAQVIAGVLQDINPEDEA